MLRACIYAAFLLAVAGCGQAQQDEAFLNESIAKNYEEFYEKGTSDAPGALAALDKAISQDEENGYSLYLKASHFAAQGDMAQALSLLEAGNSAPHVIHYVYALPPADPQVTRNRLSALGAKATEIKPDGPVGPEYFAAVREAGSRTAAAEPITSLNVIAAAGVVRRTYTAEIEYWKGLKDEKMVELAEKAAADWKSWSDKFMSDLAEKVDDVMRTAGKAAGMTEEELAEYAAGGEISDSGKMKRADEEKNRIYAEEIRSVRESLKTMPNVGSLTAAGAGSE